MAIRVFDDAFGRIIQKLHRLEEKQSQNKMKFELFFKKRMLFMELFDESRPQLALFGSLCILALFFDWIISNQTMGWIYLLTKKAIPVEIIALVFSIIDGGFSILIGGALANDKVKKIEGRKKWRFFLWGMAFIKIALFVILVEFASGHNYKGSDIMVGFQIAFTGMVYIILNWMGDGLLYLLYCYKFFVITEIINISPDRLQLKINKLKGRILYKISQYEFDKDEVLAYFKIDIRK